MLSLGDFSELSVDDVNYVPKQVNGCDREFFPCMFVLLISVDQLFLFIINSLMDKSEKPDWIVNFDRRVGEYS